MSLHSAFLHLKLDNVSSKICSSKIRPISWGVADREQQGGLRWRPRLPRTIPCKRERPALNIWGKGLVRTLLSHPHCLLGNLRVRLWGDCQKVNHRQAGRQAGRSSTRQGRPPADCSTLYDVTLATPRLSVERRRPSVILHIVRLSWWCSLFDVRMPKSEMENSDDPWARSMCVLLTPPYNCQRFERSVKNKISVTWLWKE